MLEIRQNSFYLDGKPFRLISGAIHYFRVVPEYWEDRLKKLKQAGFNAVETYMCWNLHEPKEGVFCFDGILDFIKFCKIAQKIGLYVILRPGPYICAEWDFGGLPAWLLKDKNIKLRCNSEPYMSKVKHYFEKIMPMIFPLQQQNGGNIIAMQVENEYGSYGNDKNYLYAVKKIILDNGITVPLFTSDGCDKSMISGGMLPEVYKTVNFGSNAQKAFNCLENVQPNMPKTVMEFWCGWFDHWSNRHHTRNADRVAKEVQTLIDMGANFNLYMFHGGTNFNFYAGANHFTKYLPTVTSYDYATLLNEYGDYTPTYMKVRSILLKAQNIEETPLIASPKLQNVGAVKLTEQANLFDNLDNIGTKYYTAYPESMEKFDQNFGYVLYRTDLKGEYNNRMLFIEGIHDIAYLYVDGIFKKKFDRCKNKSCKMSCFLGNFSGSKRIEIFVEGMGRINYGIYLEDRKGVERIRLASQILFGWEQYSLPMDNLEKLQFTPINKLFDKPTFYKGHFKAKTDADCFVDMNGFSKGFVVVNGFNIGRYWKKGPQRTLYLPAPILKEYNEIIVFEQEGIKKPMLKIIDTHLLGR